MKNTTKTISNELIAWYALLIILILAGIIRYGFLNVPFERDEGEYAYAGQLILQGTPPYQEVCNMKLPGIYAAYALFLSIFGQSHQDIHLALLIINAITIVIIFLLAKHIANLLCAVISASSFALLSMSQSVQGVYANAEHFVLVFAIGGLLILLRGLETDSLSNLFAAGLLLGLSFVMKQHGLAFSFLAAFYIIFYSLKQHPIQWLGLALKLVFFSSGALLVYGCLCLIMVWTGVFKSFWFWTVEYASAYISQVPIKLAWELFITAFTAIFHSAPLLWMLSGFGFVALLTKKTVKQYRMFLLMFAIFSFLSICPGFYFRSHYFVLLLPCASLLAGVTISVLTDFLSRFNSKKIQYGVPFLLIIICLCQSLYNQRYFMFYMTPFQISRSTYGMNPCSESLEIADFIKKHSSPDDRIAILGSEPQIFFYSQRRSASKYIYMYPLMEKHDFALQMQQDFINDIETINPKYLIYVNLPTSWLKGHQSHMKIFQWFTVYRQRSHLRLVGVVELLKDESLFYWEPEVKWPVRSKSWIAIFER